MELTTVTLLRLHAEGLLSASDLLLLNVLASKYHLSKRAAAKRLGIPESTLRHRLNKIRAVIEANS